MKYGRFGTFLVIVAIIVGLTAGTSAKIWHAIPLGLDLKGGISVLFRIDPDKGQTLTKAGIQAALQAVETRVNSLGVSSPIINLENGDEINVQIAGVADPQNAEQVIGQTAQLSIYSQITTDKNGQPTPVKSSLLITGNDIANNASLGQNQLGQSVVDITLKNKGQWTDITKKYLGQVIYTFLNGKMIDSAQIRAIIANGQTAIGPFATIAQSQTLAQQLNAGALPYPLKLMSYTNVGPQLGAASLQATLDAALMALVLIFLFMMVNYRMAGLIADIALVAYAYLTLLVFAAFPITLTLSGLAALVLGMGIAVDANIITYERIKDEIRAGRSIRSAVVAGSKRALRTILDSNTTTFIAASVMFWLGQGDVRGFAVALMVSIVVSLLTAVLLSRVLLSQFVQSGFIRDPRWLGAGARKEARRDEATL